MTFNVRQFHRWASMVFMLTVIANFIGLAMDRQETWLGLVALAPLIVLMVSGTWMFFRPWLQRRRASET